MTNLVKKIMQAHCLSGDLSPGSEVGLRIDTTLMHDATGQMAMLQFEALEIERVKTRRSVIYTDHNTLQIGFENMDDHRFLASAASRFGMYYSKPGNGICHQVHLERFSVPGDTLLGADSHSTTAGGIGMLAIGAGGLDVAAALAGEPFYLPMPRVLNVHLSGELPPWSTAKDVALELLRRLTVSGGRGRIIEFTGPGLKTLSTPARATIANMSTECGAFSAVFPSDDITRSFLRAQQREADWKALQADAGAAYDEQLHLDLSSIVPLVARPHSPDNVVPVASIKHLTVDQVAIGSCTNASLEDLLSVAAILKGRTIPPELNLVLAPGSRQVLMDLIAAGALQDILCSGARLMETSCGFCNGVGQAPGSKGVSLRTSNRNFPGRSGTAEADLYLVSPQTAAVSALKGELTDPRTFGEPITVQVPATFSVDDSMIVPPAASGSESEILRGPNIAPLPRFDPPPRVLTGELLLSLGDHVTTDDILPAGADILAKRANIPAISRHIFAKIDPGFYERALAAGTGFILGGSNYGQGSSREHAALAPRYLGILAVIAESFARIHKSNLVNFGIFPLELQNPEDRRKLAQGHRLRIDIETKRLPEIENIKVIDLSTGQTVGTRLDLSPRLKRVLAAGGMLNAIRHKRKGREA